MAGLKSTYSRKQQYAVNSSWNKKHGIKIDSSDDDYCLFALIERAVHNWAKRIY